MKTKAETVSKASLWVHAGATRLVAFALAASFAGGTRADINDNLAHHWHPSRNFSFADIAPGAVKYHGQTYSVTVGADGWHFGGEANSDIRYIKLPAGIPNSATAYSISFWAKPDRDKMMAQTTGYGGWVLCDRDSNAAGDFFITCSHYCPVKIPGKHC